MTSGKCLLYVDNAKNVRITVEFHNKQVYGQSLFIIKKKLGFLFSFFFWGIYLKSQYQFIFQFTAFIIRIVL